MKKKTIRGAILSLILTLGLSTAAFADGMDHNMDMGHGTEKSMGDINAELTFNKDNNVKTGDNDVMVTLHDSNGKEIDDATVNIKIKMDGGSDMSGHNHGNMNMDEPKLLDNSGNGQYMGTVNFTDKGKWTVTANVSVNGEEKNIKFDADVVSAGPNWVVIGGFVGIVAVIIVVAAVKKKSSK